MNLFHNTLKQTYEIRILCCALKATVRFNLVEPLQTKTYMKFVKLLYELKIMRQNGSQPNEIILVKKLCVCFFFKLNSVFRWIGKKCRWRRDCAIIVIDLMFLCLRSLLLLLFCAFCLFPIWFLSVHCLLFCQVEVMDGCGLSLNSVSSSFMISLPLPLSLSFLFAKLVWCTTLNHV